MYKERDKRRQNKVKVTIMRRKMMVFLQEICSERASTSPATTRETKIIGMGCGEGKDEQGTNSSQPLKKHQPNITRREDE